MRIRSVKPEYWRSPDTAELDYFTRLMYIGLWNYVDDNGVGEDNVALIRSDLFPRDDVDETSRLIHGALIELSLRAHITRYEHLTTGRRYFHVRNWHHQKINRPTKSTKPLPSSENTRLVEDSLSDHGGLTEDSLWDLGSKGSRERGIRDPQPPTEPGSPSAPAPRKTGTEIALARFANLPAYSQLASQIAQAFSDSQPAPIESSVRAEIAGQIEKCLQDDIAPKYIAEGCQEWATSTAWHTSQIPKFVTKAVARQSTNGIGKPTRKAQDYHNLGEELIAEMEEQE